ncbi:hypothetical protein Tco_0801628 [Tanacetum coccineum]|uniref:Uncharacterized protein n=1 Tax=Tanacetum coccineum TaxID=301880 RepID=A0ABQ5A0I2_9ASTR
MPLWKSCSRRSQSLSIRSLLHHILNLRLRRIQLVEGRPIMFSRSNMQKLMCGLIMFTKVCKQSFACNEGLRYLHDSDGVPLESRRGGDIQMVSPEPGLESSSIFIPVSSPALASPVGMNGYGMLRIFELVTSRHYASKASPTYHNHGDRSLGSILNWLTSIKPASEPSELEASSVYNFHVFSGSGSSSVVFSASISLFYTKGVSAKKLANICPLIKLCPLNSMCCSPSSISHLAMRPDFLGLARICFMGLSVNIRIE